MIQASDDPFDKWDYFVETIKRNPFFSVLCILSIYIFDSPIVSWITVCRLELEGTLHCAWLDPFRHSQIVCQPRWRYISLTEWNSGRIQKLPFRSWYCDWSQYDSCVRQQWHLAGCVLTMKHAGNGADSCYIFQLSRSMNTYENFWVVPVLY